VKTAAFTVPRATGPQSGVRQGARAAFEAQARCAELEAENAALRALLARRDEMAALLVHDLKGPLSAMTMNVDVAIADVDDAIARGDERFGDTRTALEDCRVAGARLYRMIANLLDVARAEEGRLTPSRASVDVGALARRIARDHASEAAHKRVSLACEIEDDVRADADAELLARVVENLLENGVRFARADGRVLVRVARCGDGEGVEIEVANDGPSIPAELRAHVFEKYVQVHPRYDTRALHRGLGLYFCRLAVEAHGGWIEVADRPGFATCFRVVLP
jgi:signal transduction histidine kinase